MKHTKKNIAILTIIIVSSTMTHGPHLAEPTIDATCVIPSLLADRKKSDTINVLCIPDQLTRIAPVLAEAPEATPVSSHSELKLPTRSLLKEIVRYIKPHRAESLSFSQALQSDIDSEVQGNAEEVSPQSDVQEVDTEVASPRESSTLSPVDVSIKLEEEIETVLGETHRESSTLFPVDVSIKLEEEMETALDETHSSMPASQIDPSKISLQIPMKTETNAIAARPADKRTTMKKLLDIISKHLHKPKA